VEFGPCQPRSRCLDVAVITEMLRNGRSKAVQLVNPLLISVWNSKFSSRGSSDQERRPQNTFVTHLEPHNIHTEVKLILPDSQDQNLALQL
jgi:hypothetical protein